MSNGVQPSIPDIINAHHNDLLSEEDARKAILSILRYWGCADDDKEDAA